MAYKPDRQDWFLILGLAGVLVSAARLTSGLSGWPPLSFFGTADKARELNLFGLPIGMWEILIYCAIILFARLMPAGLLWLISGVLGLQLGLQLAGPSTRAASAFCLINLLLLTTLFIFSLRKERLWQAVPVIFVFFMFSSLTATVWSKPQTAFNPSEEKQADKVAALVAGQAITFEDLDRTIASRIFELEDRIYQLRKQRLDQAIAQVLLEKEAGKRGTTQQKLVDDEVLARGVEVSQEELENYYQKNSHLFADWKGSEQELKQKITDSLGKQKGYQKVIDYALSFADEYGVQTCLKQPVLISVQVSAGNDPARGPLSAPVTIIEFSDYQCPACRKTHETVGKLREMHPQGIRWVFKDYPMKQGSRAAAEAARCADEQGKFWEYQDLLFSGKGDFTAELLTGYAKQLGLDLNTFNRCCESRKYQDQVKKNLDEGARIGLIMTPTYIVNGKMIPGGPSLEDFTRIISRESSGEADKDQRCAKASYH